VPIARRLFSPRSRVAAGAAAKDYLQLASATPHAATGEGSRQGGAPLRPRLVTSRSCHARHRAESIPSTTARSSSSAPTRRRPPREGGLRKQRARRGDAGDKTPSRSASARSRASRTAASWWKDVKRCLYSCILFSFFIFSPQTYHRETLLATDVAPAHRVDHITRVINFERPQDRDTYCPSRAHAWVARGVTRLRVQLRDGRPCRLHAQDRALRRLHDDSLLARPNASRTKPRPHRPTHCNCKVRAAATTAVVAIVAAPPARDHPSARARRSRVPSRSPGSLSSTPLDRVRIASASCVLPC